MGPEEYATKLGWKIFPTHAVIQGKCTCGRSECKNQGKHPRTANGFQDASSDPAVIQQWWKMWPTANIAVATGRVSGIFVVDIDPRHSGFQSIDAYEQEREEGPLPDTLKSATGGGGRHLFYAYPEDGPLGGRQHWLPGVDVKADGGYVVLPPGTHISGGRYVWLNYELGAVPVRAPRDLLLSIRDTTSGSSTGSSLPDTASILDGVPEGKRDDTLYRAACRWRRQHQGDTDGGRKAVTALVLAAARACEPPFPEDEALRKVTQAFKQDHNDENTQWGYISDEGHKLHHLTDMGNRNRLLDVYGEDIRYVPEWGWLLWSDMGWQIVPTEYIMALCEKVPDIIRNEATVYITDANKQMRWVKWSFSSESAGSLSAVERVARQDTRIIKRAEDFDSDDHMIAARNGIINLRTGFINEFTKDTMVTKNTNVQFDPDFRLDLWEDFLKKSTEGDDEMVRYLQRAAGYTLTGSTAEECFFVLSGPTASGKSTFVEALLGAAGTYGAITQSDTFMYRKNKDAAREELASLIGKRVTAISEIREGEVFNVPLINQVTGGDKVKAKFLYKNPFDYRPQFKLWLATNHDPASQDEALLRRIKRIPFRRTIPAESRDPRLKAMLKDPETGGRAVLAWAVRGAIEWHQTGLMEPDSVKLAVHEYRSENDAFGRFIEDCLVREPESEVDGRTAFQTFLSWCPVNNERPVRRPQFNQRMTERGFTRTPGDAFLGLRLRQMRLSETGVTWS